MEKPICNIPACLIMANSTDNVELTTFVHLWKTEIHQKKRGELVGPTDTDKSAPFISVPCDTTHIECTNERVPSPNTVDDVSTTVENGAFVETQLVCSTKPLLEFSLGSTSLRNGSSASSAINVQSSGIRDRKHRFSGDIDAQPHQRSRVSPSYTQRAPGADSKLDLTDSFFDVGDGDSDDDATDFVSLLIKDIDDVNDVPLFDYTLPIEVATNILSHLDVKSLCHCAQTSKTWNLLASDDALWHRLAQEHGYTLPTNLHSMANRDFSKQKDTVNAFEKRASQTWKEYFVQRHLHEREIHRRWREMIAVFVQLRRPKRFIHGDDRRSGVTSASYNQADGVMAAGLNNSQVILWNLDRPSQELEKYFTTLNMQELSIAAAALVEEDARQGPRANAANTSWQFHGAVVSVDANACVAAAITSPSPTTRELHVWHLSRHGGTRVFASDAPVEVPHVNASCPLVAVTDSPTVVWGCGKNIHCYSADTSSTWELHWSWTGIRSEDITDLCMVSTASGVQNKGIFVHMTLGSVGLHNIANGDVVASLYGDDDSSIGTTCSCLHTGKEHIAYAVHDIAVGNSVRVHCTDTGRQSGAIDLGSGRVVAVTSVTNEPDVYVISTTHGIGVYDMRTDTREQRFQRHGATLLSLCADDWKIVAGGSQAPAGQDGFTGVWDRRMRKRLWYVNDVVPIVSVAVYKEERLVTSSVPAHAPYVEPNIEDAYHITKASLNVVDFGAPLSQLVDAECPFSSMFDSVAGYRYNDLLANPYDNVDPYAFQ